MMRLGHKLLRTVTAAGLDAEQIQFSWLARIVMLILGDGAEELVDCVFDE